MYEQVPPQHARAQNPNKSGRKLLGSRDESLQRFSDPNSTRLRQLLAVCLLVSVFAPNIGCAAYNRNVDQWMVGWRNTVWADAAWRRDEDHFSNQPYAY